MNQQQRHQITVRERKIERRGKMREIEIEEEGGNTSFDFDTISLKSKSFN